MAADDAVSLLRSLKAAGEKTGAVEAEGALHLRRNSRRTMDGNHICADAVAVLQGSSPAVTLPAPRFPVTATALGAPGGATGGSSSPTLIPALSPTLIPALSFTANATPTPSLGSSSANGASSLTLPHTASASGSLPIIASTTSSPAASPSRLSIRAPAPLTSLPSPTGSSPGGGGGSAAAAAVSPAVAAVPSGGLSGPPSPQCPGPGAGALHLNNPGTTTRRAIHALSLNGMSYDAVQLPHTHGSPLPLIFDPPVSLPPPSASSPTGAANASGGPGPCGSAPGSPGLRQVQMSLGAPASPSGPSPSLPSIAVLNVGGAGGGGGGPFAPPTAPAPIPCLVPVPPSSSSSYIRVGSARSSIGGAPATSLLVAAAASGGGGAAAGGGPPPLCKSLPITNTPPGAASPNSPGGGGGGGRALMRPLPGGTPFGLPQAATSAGLSATSPGSPSPSSPVPGLAAPGPRMGPYALEAGGHASGSPLQPLMPSAAQAALQLQLQAVATAPLPLTLQHALQQMVGPTRPSSARSVAGCGGGGAVTVPEGLSGTLSSRRLSMTGAFESSQKLVLAAAHELSSLHHQQQHHNHHHQQQQQQQSQHNPPPNLQQILPPPRLSVSSARGPSVSLAGAASGAASSSGGGGGAGSAAAPPRLGLRDSRSSDPGTFGAAAAAAEPPEFGFPTPTLTPDPLQPPQPQPLPPPAGRPSLAPLQGGALQAVIKASTPPPVSSSASSSGLGRPLAANSLSVSPQLSLRAVARPEPLQQRPEPPAGAAAAAVALPTVSTSLPEPLQPLPPLLAAGAVAGLSSPAAVGVAAVAAVQLPGLPLGRAGTLAPLGLMEEAVVVVGAGPVAESTLGSSTPDLDPAALFGPGSGAGSGSTGAGFMELTVRSMAAKPTSSFGFGGAGGGGSSPVAGDRFAVQSSVRQRLQTDPLRFHPPAPGAGRGRPGYLDPLEATPRLVLAGGGGGAAMPPLRQLPSGRLDGPKTPAAAAGDLLWVPSQDIVPHLLSRTSSGGGGAAAALSGRLSFHTATSPTGPSTSASPPMLIPSTPSLEPSTPRLRTNSGTGGTPTGEGAAVGPLMPPSGKSSQLQSTPSQQLRLQQQQVTAGGLQSNYLKALAAAAGLADGSGSGGGGFRLLQRQRSLSDSGCGGSGFLAAVAAAADSGPVGLPLEGGLAVLGDMWSRVRAERHHNTRYNTAVDEAAGGEFGSTLEDIVALRAPGEATSGPLPAVAAAAGTDPRVFSDAASPGTPAPAPPLVALSSLPPHQHPSSPRRNLSGSYMTASAGSSLSASKLGLRPDASVSSLPLKALRAAPSPGPAATAGGAGATEGAAAGAGRKANP